MQQKLYPGEEASDRFAEKFLHCLLIQFIMHASGIIRMLLIVGSISLLLDWYVYNGLKTLTRGWQSRRLRGLVKYGYLVVSLGVAVQFFSELPSFRKASGMTPYHEWVLSLFL